MIIFQTLVNDPWIHQFFSKSLKNYLKGGWFSQKKLLSTKTYISHLVNGDDETSKERLQQLSDGLLSLLVHRLDHHHYGLKQQRLVNTSFKDCGWYHSKNLSTEHPKTKFVLGLHKFVSRGQCSHLRTFYRILRDSNISW